MNNQIRIAAMSDSPKIVSGFGTVAREIYQGFHEAGYLLHALGFMDDQFDYEHVLPYYFDPTTLFDELGHSTFPMFLRKVKPDVIFILTDPGNLVRYVDGIVHNAAATYRRNGRDFVPPVVAYCPIEGTPLDGSFKHGFECVLQTAGRLIFYNQKAKDNVAAQWPEIAENADVVWHGSNHAPFRRYSDEERRILKELTGLDKHFVIGSVGANKRTKGFVELIYTAAQMKELGIAEGVKFYCHTNPVQPTMMGYQLGELVKYYGVADMFLWKQIRKGNYWTGLPRWNGSVDDLLALKGKIPETPEERGYLFYSLDFVSMLNCLDMYVDLSQSEGWCLPTTEALASGVPTLMIDDGDVRSSLLEGGYYPIRTMPKRTWTTLHTGARLPTIDPLDVAKAIDYVRSKPLLMRDLSERGQAVVSRYNWNDTRAEMNKIVGEVAQFVMEEDKAYA